MIKWAQPVIEHHGPMAFIKASKNHVTFGFWRGADLKAPAGLLEGDGDRMKHLKIGLTEEVRVDVVSDLVRQAAAQARARFEQQDREVRVRETAGGADSGGPAAAATACVSADAARSGRSLSPLTSANVTTPPMARLPASSTFRESLFGDGGLARIETSGVSPRPAVGMLARLMNVSPA